MYAIRSYYDRDRAGRLHARAYPERCLRRDRRGAELHLCADQDAAEAHPIVELVVHDQAGLLRLALEAEPLQEWSYNFV